MNIVTRFIAAIFDIGLDTPDDSHNHLEALHGDSALIRLVCELRDLKIELGQTGTTAS